MEASQYIVILWVGGGLGILAGAVLLIAARHADRKNYIVQRATPMPLKLVNERDDVWLRGKASAPHPVSAPHFGYLCLYYRYRLEERVKKTRRRNNKTETYYTWETRERKSEATRFTLDDGTGQIAVNGEQADFKHLSHKQDREGKWRHSVSYLASPSTVSAVGSVGEKREWLEPYANIPLMVTPRERDDYIRGAESGETAMRVGGYVLLPAGMTAALYGLFDYLSWPVRTGGEFDPAPLIVALIVSLFVFLPIWVVYAFNTLVTHRHRFKNAWHQVDVDLKMRYDLIPRLVDVAKGYFKHERELLERITALRTKAVQGDAGAKIAVEGEMEGAMGRIQAVIEDYPDLKSQPLTEKLMRELTAIEEKIAHGRITYNEAVKEYNDNVQMFPKSILAGAFGFSAQPLFQAEADEREAVQIGGESGGLT